MKLKGATVAILLALLLAAPLGITAHAATVEEYEVPLWFIAEYTVENSTIEITVPQSKIVSVNYTVYITCQVIPPTANMTAVLELEGYRATKTVTLVEGKAVDLITLKLPSFTSGTLRLYFENVPQGCTPYITTATVYLLEKVSETVVWDPFNNPTSANVTLYWYVPTPAPASYKMLIPTLPGNVSSVAGATLSGNILELPTTAGSAAISIDPLWTVVPVPRKATIIAYSSRTLLAIYGYPFYEAHFITAGQQSITATLFPNGTPLELVVPARLEKVYWIEGFTYSVDSNGYMVFNIASDPATTTAIQSAFLVVLPSPKPLEDVEEGYMVAPAVLNLTVQFPGYANITGTNVTLALQLNGNTYNVVLGYINKTSTVDGTLVIGTPYMVVEVNGTSAVVEPFTFYVAGPVGAIATPFGDALPTTNGYEIYPGNVSLAVTASTARVAVAIVPDEQVSVEVVGNLSFVVHGAPYTGSMVAILDRPRAAKIVAITADGRVGVDIVEPHSCGDNCYVVVTPLQAITYKYGDGGIVAADNITVQFQAYVPVSVFDEKGNPVDARVEVYDESGRLVASGSAGTMFKLFPGNYTLKIYVPTIVVGQATGEYAVVTKKISINDDTAVLLSIVPPPVKELKIDVPKRVEAGKPFTATITLVLNTTADFNFNYTGQVYLDGNLYKTIVFPVRQGEDMATATVEFEGLTEGTHVIEVVVRGVSATATVEAYAFHWEDYIPYVTLALATMAVVMSAMALMRRGHEISI